MSKVEKYEVIIYWSDEDSTFVADVPELPGCRADGVTREEGESIVLCHQVRTLDKRLHELDVIPMGCYQGDGKCLIY